MLSSKVKFLAERQTDIGKTKCLQSIDARGTKNLVLFMVWYANSFNKLLFSRLVHNLHIYNLWT